MRLLISTLVLNVSMQHRPHPPLTPHLLLFWWQRAQLLLVLRVLSTGLVCQLDSVKACEVRALTGPCRCLDKGLHMDNPSNDNIVHFLAVCSIHSLAPESRALDSRATS